MNIDKYIYELYNKENSDYNYDYDKYSEDREYNEDMEDREWRENRKDRECREDREWKKCRKDKEDKECREHRRHDNRPRESTSIIPFASGGPVTLVTSPPNLHQVMAAIAFGNQSPVVADPTTRDIILTPPQTPPALNMAFSMPRFGIIRSIAAYFSITSGVTIPAGTTVTVRAQLYQSTAPNDTFTPIAGTLVTLVPSFSGTLVPGNRAHAILSNLRIPVRPETRLLLVFSAVASPNTTRVTLIGHASAGITIR